jgi:hypothetical protein
MSGAFLYVRPAGENGISQKAHGQGKKMDKRPDFKSFKEEVLKNALVRAEYEASRPEFERMMKFIVKKRWLHAF